MIPKLTIRSRGYLPHWEIEGGIYSITFRLADSLPQNVLKAIRVERAALFSKQLLDLERQTHEEALNTRIEKYLACGAGKCHLRNPAITQIMVDALLAYDEKRYRLYAWCVMPNHVHVVATILPGHELQRVVQAWKSVSSRRAISDLKIKAPFWQREYYDHIVRRGEFFKTIDYVAKNPEKAGLKDYRWVCVYDERCL